MSVFNSKCCVYGNKVGITAVTNKDFNKMFCSTCRKKITL